MSKIKYMPIGRKPMGDKQLIAFLTFMATLMIALIIGVTKAYLELQS